MSVTIPSEKDLLKAACHFGHKKNKWNPRMAPHIYGVRNGIHVFDLAQTHKHLADVCDALHDLAQRGATILFVSTKQQTTAQIEHIGRELGYPTVTKKWIPGLLTNWQTVKRRLQNYLDLQESFKTGEIEKYTKKEQTQKRKELTKLDIALGGVAGMSGMPDAIFVIDAVRDEVAVKEANTLNIPVYGICDSNADPSLFTKFVPCNDDAVKSVTIILDSVESALSGKPATATTAA